MISARWVHRLWAAANKKRYRKYLWALDHPEIVQTRLLHKILLHNRRSVVGQSFGFDRIRSVRDYQCRVPVSIWSDYERSIRRIAAGKEGVLTEEPVRRFVPSSGSTSACKLVPYTSSLIKQFNAAIGPWVVDLFQRLPEVVYGPSYWSISPAFDGPKAESVVPIGFDSDSDYLGGAFGPIVASAFAVPNVVSRIRGIDAFQYVTLLFLLRAKDLRMVSVWHPSFFSILLDRMQEDWDRLMHDLECGGVPDILHTEDGRLSNLSKGLRPDVRRAEELKAVGPVPVDIWQRLCCVSCWTDGAAAAAARELAGRIAHASMQPKGLISTEAIVSLPFAGSHPVAVCSHYFEFIDEQGRLLLTHELEIGGKYEVIVTTGGGLYRYRIGDQVQVDGMMGQTPSLRFIGRSDGVSDLFGEKLNETHVSQAIESILLANRLDPKFVMLAVDQRGVEKTNYTLYIECECSTPLDLGRQLDVALSRNPHYRYCLSLGQLKPIRVYKIARDGHGAYLTRLQAMGRRFGDIKPRYLSSENGWADWFDGGYVLDEITPAERCEVL